MEVGQVFRSMVFSMFCRRRFVLLIKGEIAQLCSFRHSGRYSNPLHTLACAKAQPFLALPVFAKTDVVAAAAKARSVPQPVNLLLQNGRAADERPETTLHRMVEIYACAEYSMLRARAARKSNSQRGLFRNFRRVIHERQV